MADEALFEDLHDGGIQMQIKNFLKLSKFKSILHVEVYRRKEKLNWFLSLFVTKRTRIIKFTVNEPQYIMESLMDGLSLEKLVEPYSDQHILEIVDEQENEVV